MAQHTACPPPVGIGGLFALRCLLIIIIIISLPSIVRSTALKWSWKAGGGTWTIF